MWTKCPHCNRWHEVVEMRETPPLDVIIQTTQLSRVAMAILQNRDALPHTFLQGDPVSLQLLGDLLGYTAPHVRAGLIELQRYHLVGTVPFGKSGRQRYVGTSRLSRVKLSA
jgi:hypothetical protein